MTTSAAATSMSGASKAAAVGSPIGFALRPALQTLNSLKSSPRPNILTVDDAKAVRRLVEAALREFDCDVAESDNGYKALYAMERCMPDLILLDVNMPTMGGLPMLELLRKSDQPALIALPVIMLTSPGDHDVAGEIAALGVRATLMKPFTPAQLIEKIRGVIELRLRRSSTSAPGPVTS